MSSYIVEFESLSKLMVISLTMLDVMVGAIATMGFINNTSEWRGGAVIYISTKKKTVFWKQKLLNRKNYNSL